MSDKIKKLTFWAMLLLYVGVTGFYNASAENWAVIVGINDYQTIMPDLRYCESDAQLMRETLIKYAGFKEGNIKMLLSKEATKMAIRNAIRGWLRNNVSAGDRALFYFSGHGIQMKDYNGDELDGKDELICPHEAGRWDIMFIKDDEIDKWFAEINTADKLVIFDCCHSGTAVREVSFTNTVKEYHPSEPIRIASQGGIHPELLYLLEDYMPNGVSKGQEDTVLISGCAADQVSMESPKLKHGVLTYFFSQSFTDAADTDGDGNLSVEEVVRLATKKIKAAGWRQDPQLEGPYQGKVWVNQSEVTEPYGTITAIEGDTITISLNKENGLTKGSIYTVFGKVVTSFAGPGKGQIRVTAVSERESTCSPLELSAELEVNDKVTEFARKISSEKLLLQIDAFETSDAASIKVAQKIIDAMKSLLSEKRYNYIKIVPAGEAPDKILRGNVRQDVDVHEIIARLVNVSIGNAGQPFRIKTKLEQVDSAAKVLIRALSEQLRTGYVTKTLSRIENPKPKFKINLSVDRGEDALYNIGETMTISVQPTRDCFITLLNITTGGKVYVLFPNEYERDNNEGDNNFVKSGQEYVIPSNDEYVIQIGGPTGTEMIKAIATTYPANLARLNPGDMNNPIKTYVEEAPSLVDDIRALVDDIQAKDLHLKPVHRWATESIIIQVGRERLYRDKDPMEIQQLE